MDVILGAAEEIIRNLPSNPLFIPLIAAVLAVGIGGIVLNIIRGR